MFNSFGIPDGRKGAARHLRKEVVVQDKGLQTGGRERERAISSITSLVSPWKERERERIMVSPALSLSPLPVGFLCVGFSFKIIAYELSLPNQCLFPLPNFAY